MSKNWRRSPTRPAPQLSPSTPPSRKRWRGCSRPPTSGSANRTWSSSTQSAPGPRPDRRSRPGGGAQGHRDFRLRRLPDGARGGAAHDPEGSRRDPAHRSQRQRQGLPALGRLRDGQVRIARPGAEHGAGAGPKGIHVAHFIIDGGVRSARRPDPADSRTARSTRMRSRRPISRSCASRAAPGRSKSRLRPWVETF